MKNRITYSALLILIPFFFACNRDNIGYTDADTLIVDNLSGMRLSGTVDDDFLYVENLSQKGDTIFGNYVLQDKSVLVERKEFLLVLDDGVAQLKSPDFDGRFDYLSGIEDGEIHVTIEKQRRVLWVIPWGKKRIEVNLSPYNITHKDFLSGRYEEDVFPDMILKEDVEYGKAKGYWTSFESEDMSYWEILGKGTRDVLRSKEQSLLMDVYMPAMDEIENRPLLVLIHGGGFYIGDKAESTYLALAHYYVRKGYVVASINYRMGFLPSSKAVERAGYRGVQDARAALRFLSLHHEEFGFDPQNIFLAGSSAGAITSLNVAFMDDDEIPESAKGGLFKDNLGKLDESGNEIEASYKVRAVMNMWGAVDKTAMIDNDEEVALIHFHGDSDMVVPYACGFPFEDVGGHINEWFMPQMCGSKAIDDVAEDKQWYSELVTFHGAGHMPHVNEDKSFNENFDTILIRSKGFFFDQLKDPDLKIVGDEIVSVRQKSCEYVVTGKMPVPVINWDVKGGIIKDVKKGRAVVLWYSNAKYHTIMCDVVSNIGVHTNLSMPVQVL